MTVFFEISSPWNWGFWSIKTNLMVRFGFGPFAAGWLLVPFQDFGRRANHWEDC